MQNTTTQSSSKKAKKAQKRYASLDRALPSQAFSSDKLALTHSRYLQSILDPWNVRGSKIPDEITLPSFPMNATTKIVLNAATSTAPGPTGRGLVYTVGSSNPLNSGKYVALNPLNATADTYTSVGPVGNWQPGLQLGNVGSSVRPVSAGLFVNCQGSENTNQGRIIIGFIPPNDPLCSIAISGSNITATALDNAAFSTSFPLSKVSGRAIWIPIDDIARSYQLSGSTTLGTSSIRAGNGTASVTYGLLFALIDGVAATALPQLEFIASENFEVIPISSQVNIAQPEVSTSDPIEMSLASNFLAKRPTLAAYQPTASAVTGTPISGSSLTRPDRGDGTTIMDKILGGLMTGAKVAGKLAPVALELLSTL